MDDPADGQTAGHQEKNDGRDSSAGYSTAKSQHNHGLMVDWAFKELH
jgi:hypothetical protein